MDIEDESTGATTTVNVKIQYDYLLKYCKECKLQGHDEFDCRVINPKLALERVSKEGLTDTKQNRKNGIETVEQIEEDHTKDKEVNKGKQKQTLSKEEEKIKNTGNQQKFTPRMLSGKVVGNPGSWNLIKDNRIYNKNDNSGQNKKTCNKEKLGVGALNEIQTKNQYEALTEKDQIERIDLSMKEQQQKTCKGITQKQVESTEATTHTE
ncbi:hypothetical protein KY290_017353 [Solanum tuberosum]|uniref:Uncharacterized protein n=2 Tax=Solanum tuberosum TaxID=4113 RepID=A0ABQ7VB21_SOLTU|nr:hypothetical protein KY289_016578 [Solanum tuberosum]KAH0761280.1 hypothetical protein KY290_017353 [Solanum tuberosum]